MQARNQFKAVTRSDSRIGVLKGAFVNFRGSHAPTPNPPITNPNEYSWTGAKSGFGSAISVTFNTAGEFTETLTVRGKTRTVRITVADVGPGPGFMAWRSSNPASGSIVGSCAIDAQVRSTTLYGNPGISNVGNSVKHSYWNACIANMINSQVANEATTAYEWTNYRTNPENETVMDLENNADGRIIGDQLPPVIGQPLIMGRIEDAARSGTLTILDDPGNGGRAGLLQPSY